MCPIFVFILQEPLAVAKLLNIRAVQHAPLGQKNSRIAQHYKASIKATFEFFPVSRLVRDFVLIVPVIKLYTTPMPCHRVKGLNHSEMDEAQLITSCECAYSCFSRLFTVLKIILHV